jgi:flagellar hook protein FlgE
VEKGLAMIDIGSISQSGVAAFTNKLDVTANNIANSASEKFTASRVDMAEKKNGGVEATVTKTVDQVDISREAVEMLSTVTGFKANVQAMKTSQEMSKSLLDIIS